MCPLGPHFRTAVLILLVPATILVGSVTQSIQSVLLGVGVLYLLTAGLLWLRAAEDNRSAILQRDFLLRRGGAWVLLLFVGFVTLLVTQAFMIGGVTAAAVYIAGVLDQASLRVADTAR
jgi:hypothetical protein